MAKATFIETMRFSLVEAFRLVTRNRRIYAASLLLVLLGLMRFLQRPNLPHATLLQAIFVFAVSLVLLVSIVALAVVMIAWPGVEAALMKDSYVSGSAKWNRLRHYLWTYLKRLAPLLLVSLVLYLPISRLSLQINSARLFSYLSSALSVSLSTPLIALIVIHDLSFVAGVARTFELFRKDLLFFLSLFCLASLNYFLLNAIGTQLSAFFSPDYAATKLGLSSAPNFTILLLSPISTFTSLTITSFSIVYLVGKKKLKKTRKQ